MSTDYKKATKTVQFENDITAVLNSPSLISGSPFVTDENWFAEFRAQAIMPNFSVYQGNNRLGFYYQWLWQQLIIAHPHYELVAEEIPLKWNKRTLGAIDFLVKNNKTDQLEHWEVAIKFYLAHRHSWLGPNANDNLDKKTTRMLGHQLTLCDHPAFKQQLAPQYGQPKVKRLIMQGRLFYPINKKETGSDIATNPNALTGTWCYRSQATDLQLKPITKAQWICPPHYQGQFEYINLGKLSIPTQAISPDDKIWFVVPDHWPIYNQDR